MKEDLIPGPELGQRLKEIRLRAGLKQADVGERMGLSGAGVANSVARLENGRVRNPSLRTLLLFLRACDASLYELAGVLEGTPGVEST